MTYQDWPLERLADRALSLTDGTTRALLGIAGEPGSGKSTLADQLLGEIERRCPGMAAAVSMDGFHLAHHVLQARGDTHHKGTIDTFDAHGFLHMLRRTRQERHHSVWWPEFRRDLEDPLAGATGITPAHRLVLVDGNFLLSTRLPWLHVTAELTETWFLDAAHEPRRDRLRRRYIHYGFSPQAAQAKAHGIDEETSALIRRDAHRADLTLTEAG
ncbi:nucleoside/nucleotide kinase family protein [Streptomyces sp. SID14478]|uniref:nucleoside/nucleotide kinase family protein n=1 Tax=Streptomyces sp. SID14478 TaxID=2706073 RepID=UPI0013DCFB5C|nr:nucleoside/nucleotide kinase family protein [Streptomyces sp. SID14478]